MKKLLIYLVIITIHILVMKLVFKKENKMILFYSLCLMLGMFLGLFFI
jgi:hypothetical protein